MSFKIILEERAEHEIREIYAWYFNKSVLAAGNLQKEITQTIESLKSGMVEHRKLMAQIRRIQLKIFPYNIYYIKQDSDQIIQIIAVLHNKRDTDFVITRLLE
jgi:plasmid stabilization system protein ParE